MAAGAPSGIELAAAVRRRLRWAGLLANGWGGVDVFLFLVFLVPISGAKPGDFDDVILINTVAGAAFLAVPLWIGPV